MEQRSAQRNPVVAVPEAARISLWSLVLGMTISPGTILADGARPASPTRGLAVAAVAFALFFGLSGLESSGIAAAFGFGLLGATLGAAGVLAAALPTCLISRFTNSPRTVSWCVAAFGSAYAPMLLHAAAGLAFHLVLGWNTAVAFGASGLLWSVRPLFAVSSRALGEQIGRASCRERV